MIKRLIGLLCSVLLAVSCSATNNISGENPTSTVQYASPTPEINPFSTSSNSNETSPATILPTMTDTLTVAMTATPSIPSGTVVVNTFDQEIFPFKQNGNCSLGEAIWAVQTQQAQDECLPSSGNSTIYLPTGTYILTNPDTSSPPMQGAEGRFGFDPGGFPVIYTAVTILGNGSMIQRNGSTQFSIFQVTAQGNLTLNDLTLSGGDNSISDFSEGGALDMQIGQATLNRVTVTSNRSYDGGGLSGGLGSTLILNASTVQGNIATDDGGGIYNSGTLIINDSVIESNTAQDQALGGGGIYNDAGQVVLDHSQLNGNIAFEGGGMYSDSGTVKVIDQSIVSGNIATEVDSGSPHGGGGINGITTDRENQLIIDSSFILGNAAIESVAGGIYSQGNLQVTNSIIAYNIASGASGVLNDLDGVGSITSSCILQNQTTASKPSGFGSGIVNGNDAPFNASGNWWGSASGSGNAISDGIDAKPPLSAAPAICSGAIPTPYPTPIEK